MRRSTVATLLAAAVVGLGSGSLTAVARGGIDGGTSTTATGSSRSGAIGRLLYLRGQELHDGESTVEVQEPLDDVQRLVRAANGWVLAEHVGTTEPAWRLLHVREDGSTTTLAEAFGSWDVDPSGTRVAGVDTETGAVRVWTLDGRVVADAGVVPETRDVSWGGNDAVVIGALRGGDGWWRVWRWPMGRIARLSTDGGLEELTASRDGGLVVGLSSPERAPLPAGPNTCLQVASTTGTVGPRGTAVSALTCDWVPMSGTRAVFSPDGRRVLAMPSGSDGFGPGEAATFSARDGVRRDLRVLDLPDWTRGVQWLDADRLVVDVAVGGVGDGDGPGSELRVCSRTGGCRPVARDDETPLLVGEQY